MPCLPGHRAAPHRRRQPYAYYARVAALLNPRPAQPTGVEAGANCLSAVPPSAYRRRCPPSGVGSFSATVSRSMPAAPSATGLRSAPAVILYPNVTVYAGCVIGRNAVVHSGAVIGADGFGFAPDQGRWVKIPQIGRVVIGDDVEIGANTSIDRGALDDTVIGDGVKLDNQIQIGHNCVIGDHAVIAGCVGIAGSTRIGAGCTARRRGDDLGPPGDRRDGNLPGSMVMKSITRRVNIRPCFPEEHDRWLHNAAQVNPAPVAP